ncbi:MAG: hypothetical protein GY868_10840 [Deltaproteobacteria bacterium]|nr:hypothetical protein [Deltaproteobacteria bacterium]
MSTVYHKKRLPGHSREKGGFTLVELIFFIVILSMVALVAAPRMTGIFSARLSAAARMVADHINYAQALSLSTGDRHRIIFNSSLDTYTMDDGSATVAFPGGDTVIDVGSVYEGIKISAAYTVRFTVLGEPDMGGGGSVTLSHPETGSTRTITIDSLTGRIKVN